jgi:uncharacterized glyoxalase superfamily protein PhnB
MKVVECSCCGQVPKRGSVALNCHPEIVICYDCLDWLNGKRAKRVAAHDGAVRVVGLEPVFSVVDVERAVDHYQRLGFSTSHHDDTYAFAHRGDLTLHLARDDDPEAHMSAVLYIHVDDAEQLAADWRKASMEVAGPQDFDYGKREGSHVDPDGNVIRFGSPIPD